MRSETWPLLFLDSEVNYILECLKKRGRPAKIGVKRKKISVRVEGTDVEKLDFLVNEKCMTYTEIFKQGLKMIYNFKRVL